MMSNNEASPGLPDAPGGNRRARLWLTVAQIVATVGAFWYLGATVDWQGVQDAYARTSLGSFAAACTVYYTALIVGTIRWRLLLAALGAERPMRFFSLLRVYMVGLFYNMYVPGGVGGDVVRALATRSCFREKGAAGAFATVLIERAMGLGGMLVVVAGATLLFPLPGTEQFAWFGAAGLLAAVVGFVGLAFAHRIAPLLPRRLGRLLSGLPVVTRMWPIPPAVATALVTHLTVAVASHLLIVNMAPDVRVTDSLVIVPLALASAYLPISVGGVGVVELALVELLRLVGVPESDGLMAALMLRACQWAVAAPGGLFVLSTARDLSTSKSAAS